ncbi:conjugal transfer protein TraJ [Brucella sp. NBRC 12950]|uniref:plasmid mobilization protein n=1 Tax=Brucella sp. NBRC 12950 TaxID=2994518 RepID=UPI0025528A44|nr:conjugal transfer protein TraJ [Brucella sp. NBRC 12950]
MKSTKASTDIRNRTIRLRVSKTEEDEIKERAELSGLTLSAFIRSVALNVPILSAVDLAAADRLERINADLGRVAGLLKLWLATKRGEGAAASDVDALMHDFRSLKMQMKHQIDSLTP